MPSAYITISCARLPPIYTGYPEGNDNVLYYVLADFIKLVFYLIADKYNYKEIVLIIGGEESVLR